MSRNQPIPYNPDLKITKDFTWSTLKYGLCSYFALAYDSVHPVTRPFLAVMEFDADLQKEYLVHLLVQTADGRFRDAEAVYATWQESVAEITDIEFMELSTKEMDAAAVRRLIEHDIGFEENEYDAIRRFVKRAY